MKVKLDFMFVSTINQADMIIVIKEFFDSRETSFSSLPAFKASSVSSGNCDVGWESLVKQWLKHKYTQLVVTSIMLSPVWICHNFIKFIKFNFN